MARFLSTCHSDSDAVQNSTVHARSAGRHLAACSEPSLRFDPFEAIRHLGPSFRREGRALANIGESRTLGFDAGGYGILAIRFEQNGHRMILASRNPLGIRNLFVKIDAASCLDCATWPVVDWQLLGISHARTDVYGLNAP